jgi:hypothetical protein
MELILVLGGVPVSQLMFLYCLLMLLPRLVLLAFDHSDRFDDPAFLFRSSPLILNALILEFVLRSCSPAEKVKFIHVRRMFPRLFIQPPVPLRHCTSKTGLDRTGPRLDHGLDRTGPRLDHGLDRTGPRLDHGLGPAADRSCATEKTRPDHRKFPDPD